MDIKSRLSRTLLLEKITRMPDHARKLGIVDRSTFHGQPIDHAAPRPQKSASDEKEEK